VGAAGHYRRGNVDIRTDIILGIGGILGTLIGAYIANSIPPTLLKKGLGVLLLIMVIPMIRRVIREHNKQADEKKEDISEEKKKINTHRI